MSETSLSKPSPRLDVVDALRAIALLGIALAHYGDEFIGFWPPEGYVNERFAFDATVSLIWTMLTFGKFFTIFSFLFGLSFALQLESAARRSSSLVGRYVRRLLILFGFGLIHSLFYTGDILGIYAVLGLLLVPVRKLPDKWLVGVGLLLVLNVPTHVQLVRQWLNPPVGAALERAGADVNEFKNHARDHFEVRRRGSLADVAAFNLKHGFADRIDFQVSSGRMYVTLGLFLLGLSAGRNRMFSGSPENRRLFRRLLILAAILAVVSTPLAFSVPPSLDSVMTLPMLLASIAFDYHQLSLSIVYLTGFTLLFWSRPDGWLKRLVPAGRTGLTVYLTQSLLGVVYFYGYGLGMIGQLGTTLALLSGVAVFALQVWLAGIWLRHFYYGPIEWLWRSLTEGKAQRFRRNREQGLVAKENPRTL